MDKPAQDRKRKASSALRVFAEELQVTNRGRNYDLTKPQFASLLVRVEGHCSTPDQHVKSPLRTYEVEAKTSELSLVPV